MRRLFIIRKDLDLTHGKFGAMVGHCCEAYWTNFMKRGLVRDLEWEIFPAEEQWYKYRHPTAAKACKEAFERGDKFFKLPAENSMKKYLLGQKIDKDIWDEYVNGIFTKTICEAKNLNELKKAEAKAKELGLVEQEDWGYINDCCLTELKPENPDGTTTIGIWFKPLADDIAHQISKKFKLYGCFDKKRNCDVFRTYDAIREAYIKSHHVTTTNGDMMNWMLQPYNPEEFQPEEAVK